MPGIACLLHVMLGSWMVNEYDDDDDDDDEDKDDDDMKVINIGQE